MKRFTSIVLFAALIFFTACKKSSTNPGNTDQQPDLTDNGNMLMGNPTKATADAANFNNYLMVKQYFALSYSRTRGIANWVSWHTQESDLGSVDRLDDFRPDEDLPEGWYRPSDLSYSGSGFDRGHNCPSADRTISSTANSSTFVMTNIIPQAPDNNQGLWANLESYARGLVFDNNELFAISGNYGIGGTGNNGFITAIDGNRVIVPGRLWKVIVVLPQGNNDLSRVTTSTRVIAINAQNANDLDPDWKKYRTSVDAIEAATGINLLSNVPEETQKVIEAKVDDQ